MFYAQLFTSKRGTLAKIWLAAHWEKKITKAHVFECDLETTIQEILSPKVKIGLRTSGHLLVGVVRIYSRKTKYLLADCSDALVKIKVAFRPGQTDLPGEALEARFNHITLQEDFTDFDLQLPDQNTIDVVDHFSLNQCRTEDITLKETFASDYLTMGIGEETLAFQGLFDQSFGGHADCFGDEEMTVDLIDLIASTSKDSLLTDFYENAPNELPATPPPTAVCVEETVFKKPELPISKICMNSPALTETTFLVHAEEGFALAPTVSTSSLIKKRGKRKRKLVVDRSKELTNDVIRQQLIATSDILTMLDYIAPPTRQLMKWKENGGVKKLFSCFCHPLLHPELNQLFPRNMSAKRQSLDKEVIEQIVFPEDMREQTRQADVEDSAVPLLDDWSLLQESVSQDNSISVETSFARTEPLLCWNATNEESRMEVSYPEPEDKMWDHPSEIIVENSVVTQTLTQSSLDSQDMEDKRISTRAYKLLHMLKKQNCFPNATYSLHTMCEKSSRSDVAAVFFCLLVLQKQHALNLHQSAPYSDIIATPGPFFHSL